MEDEMDIVDSNPNGLILSEKEGVAMNFQEPKKMNAKEKRETIKRLNELEKKAKTVWDPKKRRRVPFDLHNPEHQKAMIVGQKTNLYLNAKSEEWNNSKTLRRGQVKDQLIKYTWEKAREEYGIEVGRLANISILAIPELYAKREEFMKWGAMAALYSIPVFTSNLFLLIMGTEQPKVQSSTVILFHYRSFFKLLYCSNDWINNSRSMAIAWFKTFIKKIYTDKLEKTFWVESLVNWFKTIQFLKERTIFNTENQEKEKISLKQQLDQLVLVNLEKLNQLDQLIHQSTDETNFLEQVESYFDMGKIYNNIEYVIVNDFCKQPGQWKNLDGKEIQIKETILFQMASLQKQAIKKYSQNVENVFTDKMSMEHWTPENQNKFCALMFEYTFEMIHIYEFGILSMFSKDLLITTGLKGIPTDIRGSLISEKKIPSFWIDINEDSNSISPQICEPVYMAILEERRQFNFIRNGIISFNDYNDPKYQSENEGIVLIVQLYSLYKFLVFKQPLFKDEQEFKQQQHQTVDLIDQYTHQMNILRIKEIADDNDISKKRKQQKKIASGTDNFYPSFSELNDDQSTKKSKPL